MLRLRYLAALPFVALVLLVALGLVFGRGNTLATGAAPQSFTLENGMNVLVIPDHRAPVVTHMVWYEVGPADDTPRKPSLIHH